MSDIPPPEQPGWYADASGAWWWWDGAGWTPQVAPSAWGPSAVDPAVAARSQERTMALVMWVVYLVGGGFVSPLVFYFVGKDKPFVRHHAAEGLNLSLLVVVPQVVGFALLLPGYIDLLDETGTSSSDVSLGTGFFVGLALIFLAALVSYAGAIAGIVKAHRGSWIPLPLGIHPVRGVVRKGATPPYDVR